jgi:uncharacterized protein DUF4292
MSFLMFSLGLGQVVPDSTHLPDTTHLTFDSLMHGVLDNQTGYKTFSGRAKLNWDDGKAEQSFQASIRMSKDSIVWMSLTGPMNIEGARIFIAPDTFEILNKSANEYLGHSFDFINNWLLFPVSFAMLQQIIAGERLDIHEKAATAVYEDSVFEIYLENDHLLEKIWVSTGNYTISKILLKDKLLTQQMSITFDNYNLLEGKPFSYHREIEVNRDGVVLKLTIDFTKAKLNENLSYPFEVSGKYKRIHDY